MNQNRILNIINKNKTNQGVYVLYWMQQAMRVEYNHALMHAIDLANGQNKPLLVVFTITKFPEANKRHYKFIIEGLTEVEEELNKLQINFVIKIGDIIKEVYNLAKRASSVVFDMGYLKVQKKWRRDVYNLMIENDLKINLFNVESDVIVPVKKAYDKCAYGAYVLRPKIITLLPSFIDWQKLPTLQNKEKISVDNHVNIDNFANINMVLNLDNSVKPYFFFKGGHSQALKKLDYFIEHKMNSYLDRSDPSLEVQSYLSPYLHFGQISSLQIYDILKDKLEQGKISGEVFDSFIEQLIVRRELAFNFVTYTENYDQFESMTEQWAYLTMKLHDVDYKEHIYTLEQLENGTTHDKYFNAAVKEMVLTGFMANYLRMFWAKQIIAWSPNFKEAYNRIVYLNNKYFYDGRDPNSFVNIAWCFGKMDRAWPEKLVYGKLRVLNSNGLKRKFDMDSYIRKINEL